MTLMTDDLSPEALAKRQAFFAETGGEYYSPEHALLFLQLPDQIARAGATWTTEQVFEVVLLLRSLPEFLTMVAETFDHIAAGGLTDVDYDLTADELAAAARARDLLREAHTITDAARFATAGMDIDPDGDL